MSVSETDSTGAVPQHPFQLHDAERWPLVVRAEEIVRQIFKNSSPAFTYHTVEHTELVVRNAMEIATALELRENDFVLLLLAAWFHDAGIPTVYYGHEKESCAIFRKHYQGVLTNVELSLIEGAILSTEIPQHAGNTFEQILCDADLHYLGGSDFFRWSDRLREEHGGLLDRYYSNLEWIDHNLQFVERHRYYTPYARERLASGLEWNIALLRERRESMAGH